MNLQASLSTLFSYASAVGVEGIFQFVFSHTKTFWIEVTPLCIVHPGINSNPDVTIEIAEQDFCEIIKGRADIEQLFASGCFKIHGDMGLATMMPQIIESALNHGDIAEKKTMNGRHPARPRFSEVVSATTPPLLKVERRSRDMLSVDEFNTVYRNKGVPVILGDAIQDWPLFKMSKQDVISCFSELQGITRNGDYVKKAFSTERDFRTTSMIDFIKSLDAPNNKEIIAEPPPYMGNNILPEKLLKLIKYPPYFESHQYIPPRLWIGPEKTLTPLHRDDTDNLFVQIWGEKKFTLAAPHYRASLGAWATSPHGGLDGCDFNPDAPDFNLFPAALDVVFLKLILEPGDILFLPEGWFHQVESLSTSLSINFWTSVYRARN